MTNWGGGGLKRDDGVQKVILKNSLHRQQIRWGGAPVSFFPITVNDIPVAEHHSVQTLKLFFPFSVRQNYTVTCSNVLDLFLTQVSRIMYSFLRVFVITHAAQQFAICFIQLHRQRHHVQW